MFTLTQLKNRGWSAGLIEKFLGEPDQTVRNPVFRSKAPVKLWESSRVQDGEKKREFIAHQAKRSRISVRSRLVAKRKRREQLDKVAAIDIYVKRWPLPKVYRAAIWDWRQRGIERDDYDRDGEDADRSTKNRWAVNYIRHNLCRSSGSLVLSGPGVNEAEAALGHKIYEEIAEVYPELAVDAYLQADRLLGRVETIGLLIGTDQTDELQEDGSPGDVSLIERKQYKLHRRIERNPSVAKRAKRIHGTRCQCCDFDFRAAYSVLGAGYIEVHHLKPLAALDEGDVLYDIRSDFAVLCANCHRMIHRMDDPSDLKGLQQLLSFRAIFLQ